MGHSTSSAACVCQRAGDRAHSELINRHCKACLFTVFTEQCSGTFIRLHSVSVRKYRCDVSNIFTTVYRCWRSSFLPTRPMHAPGLSPHPCPSLVGTGSLLLLPVCRPVLTISVSLSSLTPSIDYPWPQPCEPSAGSGLDLGRSCRSA